MRIRIGEAAARSGLSVTTLRKYASEGLVDAVRIGGQWRFDAYDLDGLVREGDCGRRAAVAARWWRRVAGRSGGGLRSFGGSQGLGMPTLWPGRPQTGRGEHMISLLRKRIGRAVEKAVHRHLGATDDRLDDVAGDLGVSPSYLSNIMHCHNNAGCPADLLVQLTRCLGDYSMITVLAEACGGLFLPMPDAEAHQRPEAIGAAREATEACAKAVSGLLAAIEDGRVTRAEVAGLEETVPAAQVAIANLLKIAAELAKSPAAADAREKF